MDSRAEDSSEITTMFTSDLIRRALDEDLGSGDVTTDSIVPERLQGVGQIVAKERLVLAGLGVAGGVFVTQDPTLKVSQIRNDGDLVEAGTIVMEVRGSYRSLLKAERTALNFIQRLCGIATLTRRFVEKTEGTKTKILDTRKTTPVLRHLDKYAVRIGGGVNHRFGLYDAILIKDNHIAALKGDVAQAVSRSKQLNPNKEIICEVKEIRQIDPAIESGADRLLLDNMNDELLQEAIRVVGGRVKTEVSGGVTLERVSLLAAMGVDFISVGALTHSAKAVDLSLEIEAEAA